MSVAVQAAKILEQRSFLVPGKLKITEHFFEVPRDYSKPSLGNIRLFARSARKHLTPPDPEDDTDAAEVKKRQQLPWLLYLQGGPGGECPAPQNYPWTNSFVEKGYQMLYLDQRGTGLSTPVSASTLGLLGDDKVQAEYMKLFRADNIVRDCEAVRQALLADYPEKKKQWSVIGQSFGGFCITTYLSLYPKGLREAFVFGGLPPLTADADEVYKRTFKKVEQRNRSYYEKFPEDVERVKYILRFLKRHGHNTVRLPSEGVLYQERFLELGQNFGVHHGIDTVHNIVLRAHTELQNFGHLTRNTLNIIDQNLSFDNHIIYAFLHEPIYCQGKASDWAAQRVRETLSAFDTNKTLDDASTPVLFTGEMIFPFMFVCYSELRKVKEVSELLAKEENWPALYDEEQLGKNNVPVYAAVYVDDMFVDFELSMETASKIKGCKTYVTNVMYHDAIRSQMEEVTEALWKLRCDTID